MKTKLDLLKDKVLAGGEINADEAYSLLDYIGSSALRDAAAEITRSCAPRTFDSCSIINARSGLCGEDCHWCAQSARYKTGCDVYPLVSEEKCLEAATRNKEAGVGRFSIVTSGRCSKGQSVADIAKRLQRISDEVGISTCASLGLLGQAEMKELYDAGLRRYHCNLEAAPSLFPSLCSTHTVDDKIRTLEAARAVGMEVCSGGIIGMGESMRQRVELALKLREVEPVSIPLNILCPIAGTPLGEQSLLSDDEILDTVAIFRFVHPRVHIRFAGGRRRLSRATQLEAMRIGINGAITGDMLTTAGCGAYEDFQMAKEADYEC